MTSESRNLCRFRYLVHISRVSAQLLDEMLNKRVVAKVSCWETRAGVEMVQAERVRCDGGDVLSQCARSEELGDEVDCVALLLKPGVVEGHDVLVLQLFQHPDLGEQPIPVLLGGHQLIHPYLIPRHLCGDTRHQRVLKGNKQTLRGIISLGIICRQGDHALPT